MKDQQPQQASAAADELPEELARQFQEGNERAFDKLVFAFRRPMFNLAYRMLNDYEEATDLTQEIFVKMYRALGKFQGASSFATWLYAIAANTCRTRLRRRRRVAQHEVPAFDGVEPAGTDEPGNPGPRPAASPSELLQRKEIRQLVQDAVATLPLDFRPVIIMRDIQGLSYEQIALSLGCSLGTVKSRLSRARVMVKERLERIYRKNATP
ncbi:MAG: sigma-70 family RNA polymerase sigma factor [Kiritimatiellae bacterium]|nr:sigma-70 family RNA polymerase sigma factor [Kiritimatiellia bacterium]